jgi:hypothetical protein
VVVFMYYLWGARVQRLLSKCCKFTSESKCIGMKQVLVNKITGVSAQRQLQVRPRNTVVCDVKYLTLLHLNADSQCLCKCRMYSPLQVGGNCGSSTDFGQCRNNVVCLNLLTS